MKQRLIFLCALALLGGCQTAPKTEAELSPEEAAKTAEAEAARAPAVPALTGEAAKSQAGKLMLEAADLLDRGKEDEAKKLLEQAVALDRDSKVANSLLRQITADPVAIYGSKSFAYALRSSETLSSIAQRYMGDLYQFYGLARYNNIRVPREVHAGQVIKIPGEPPRGGVEPAAKPAPAKRAEPVAVEAVPPLAPPAAPKAEASPGEAAYQEGMKLLRAGQKDQAYAEFQRALKIDPRHALARPQADRLRKDLIQRHSRVAMGAFHRQDLAMAIKEWDIVLELDPQDESARLKRQQAVDLSERLKKFPSNP